MATIPDSIKAQLDADWTAAGGTEPTYYVQEDYRTDPPLGKDAVWILAGTLKSPRRRVNDKFVHVDNTIDIIVNTATDEDRLKELADEVERILNATAISGINEQYVLNRENISIKRTFNYQELITVRLIEKMRSSASAYGAGTTGDFDTIGDLKVGGDDIKDSSGAVVISFDGAGAIDTLAAPHALLTDTTLTGAQLEDLLMFGSANAAWVPCIFMLEQGGVGKVQFNANLNISNVDGTDSGFPFELPLPAAKGSLKLYISGVRVDIVGANGTNYLDRTRVVGGTYNSLTAINDNGTNYDSAQLVTQTFTAVDASSYTQIFVFLNTVVADANTLKFQGVQLRCYYA